MFSQERQTEKRQQTNQLRTGREATTPQETTRSGSKMRAPGFLFSLVLLARRFDEMEQNRTN